MEKIFSQQFGEIEFDENKIISFQSGLPGFENLKKFLLLKKDDDDLFYWLNSVELPDVCFPLFGIRVLDEFYPGEPGYEPFGIVTLNRDPLKITINLKAPVYISQDESKGFQKIFDSESHPLDYKLFIG